MTHALPDPTTPIWTTDTFLRTGSVVPGNVLNFDEAGTAVGLLADPTVIPPDIAEWAKDELAHIPDWEPGPDPGPVLCGWSWLAQHGEWICTKEPGHGDDEGDDGHRAHDSHGELVQAYATEEATEELEVAS